MISRRARVISISIVTGTAIFIAGFLGATLISRKKEASCRNRYQFLNASIICDSSQVLNKKGYAEFQNTLSSFIEQERVSGKVERVSLYFRDLSNGPTFGINELDAFSPASLLKLPLALVYLRSAEIQPELLSTKIQYTGQTTVALQNFVPEKSAVPDQPYPIEELLKMMLVYSDNASYEALIEFLLNSPHRKNLLQQGFIELGIIAPENKLEETVSTRAYAGLFRLLYNVSYLDAELSEKLLSWLSESDFQKGLVAGVPKGIRVAHKFGERTNSDNGAKQLHDCGIVYFPQNPYLLCVMTKGGDFGELAEVVATISKLVYEEVESRRLK